MYKVSYIARQLRGQVCLCGQQSFPNVHHPLNFGPGNNVLQRRYKGSKKKFQSKKDLYEVLELSKKATDVQIKSAYFRMSKKHHPDVSKRKDAVRKFAEIADAYEILGKKHSRELYDKKGLYEDEDLRNTGHPDGSKAYRKGFGSYDGPPMRGRTNIYDFDAWTKTHYKELLYKKMDEKKMYDDLHDYKKEEKAYREKVRNSKMAVTVTDYVGFFVFMVIFISLLMFTTSADSRVAGAVDQIHQADIKLEAEKEVEREADLARLANSEDLETNLATD